MKTCCTIGMAATALAALICVSTPARGELGGGRSPTVNYSTQDGDLRIEVTLDKIEFSLNTVQGKYRVVRVLVENRGAKPIDLSRADDRFTVVQGRDRVAGILDLSRADSGYWDSLPADLRKSLAYPESLEKRDHQYLFVFVPQDKVGDLPQRFEYYIRSLEKTYSLEVPAPKKP